MNEVETGWLIEVVTGGRAWWWTGYPTSACGWTTDANDAIRFARKIDGERARDRHGDGDILMRMAIVTDHLWVPSGAV